ncbi:MULTISPECIES: DUF262 domain-containing protein [unclassified Sporosarcina]|uniref:DUF262 domain-containing protein n=1 Tax=unclassified Sporosarcina TaxID=2647733 RepID=UPI000C171D84|nr:MULTISPECIES: DUF262 domain-containing protein [unclassified Sporosarcina]PID04564.1 hypothetical protein CSV66_14295 [Sporosarcina sp. P30]PID07707.1 hypothetical protein CSV65_14560 [Sporosarcina sp. P31]PID10905.1 hypothetical protein CSV64_14530 [Sporosarcina sp. P32b]
MYQPEPQSVTFSILINDIDKGIIKIPQFQRDFVWSLEQSANLLDSIIKGYPIGTFILWESDEVLRSVRNIGGTSLPDTPSGSLSQYVLDGQQRMTSLYASLKGLKINRKNGVDDFSQLYIDLIADEDNPLIITNIENRKLSEVISLKNLISGGLSVLAAYPQELHQKLEDYKERLTTYRFSTILMRNSSIDIATEVFTRLNVGGKSLSVFEIMVAKTFDDSLDFDLSEKYVELTEKLEQVGYETISDSTVLQTVSILLDGECARKNILKLNKAAFISMWPKAIDAIEKTVEYFRNYYRIPVSKILPYNSLIIPFAYFFYHHPNKPIDEMKLYLDDFFWRTSLTGRYSSSVETKLAQDIKRIELILKKQLPKYEVQVDTSKEMVINNGWFSTSRSFIKAILCLMAYQEPKSFNDNSIVRISNDWLKQANSRNYHHFFPRAYLKKKGEEEFYINHIVNITIVDDFLNKHIIRAKAPSDYMKTFERQNIDLNTAMKTHLIDDLSTYGIWDNDYVAFFDKRAEKISQELQKRIIIQKTDGHQP